jgi:predicted dienelactone hydrolase
MIPVSRRQDNVARWLTPFIMRDETMKHRSLLMLTIIGAFTTLALLACAEERDGKPARQRVGRFEAGFHLFKWTYEVDGVEEPLNVGVWYPAARVPSARTKYANGVTGSAGTDPRPHLAKGPYPLIVWSHGYTGSALAVAYLAEALAERGYVVAAVDHNDPFAPMRLTGSADLPISEITARRKRVANQLLAERPTLDHARYDYRPTELTLTIDKILAESADAESPYHGLVDPERIGAGGHSMGGYTVMAMTGCLAGRKVDKRIKVVVLHSPAAWMWSEKDYARMTVPVMLMVGQKEMVLKRTRLIDIDTAMAGLPGPLWRLEIRDAHHGTFGDMRNLLDRRRVPEIAMDWPSQSGTIIHYTRAMFDRILWSHVASARSAAEKVLAEGDLWTSVYEVKAAAAEDGAE